MYLYEQKQLNMI